MVKRGVSPSEVCPVAEKAIFENQESNQRLADFNSANFGLVFRLDHEGGADEAKGLNGSAVPLGCQMHHCLAQPLPPSCKEFRGPILHGRGVHQTRVNSPRAPRTVQSSMRFSGRGLTFARGLSMAANHSSLSNRNRRAIRKDYMVAKVRFASASSYTHQDQVAI